MKPSNGTPQRAGFIKLPCELLTSPDISAQELRTWGVLKMHCIDSNECHPSMKRIAALVGVTPRHAYGLTGSLASKGFAEIISRPGKTSIFRPKLPNEDNGTLSSKDQADPGTTVQGSGVTPEPQFIPPLNPTSGHPGTTVHTEVDKRSRLQEVDSTPDHASLDVPTEKETTTTRSKSAKTKPRKKTTPITDPEKLSAILQSIDISEIKEEFEPQGLDVDRLWKRFCQTTISGNAKKDGPNPYGYVNFKAAFRGWCERELKSGRKSAPMNQSVSTPQYEDLTNYEF